MANQELCSCGCAERHEVARRQTVDGLTILLWSDGSVTGRFSTIPGLPGRRGPVRAGWLFIDEVTLATRAELPALYSACSWAARRNGTRGEVQSRLRELARPRYTTNWEIYETDRDGKPVTRLWRLPRLTFGRGMAVWDHCSRGGHRGRYELVHFDRRNVASNTGVRFSTLREMFVHLDSIRIAA